MPFSYTVSKNKEIFAFLPLCNPRPRGYDIGTSGKKWEMRYFGTYDRNLDDKGRLQLPPKLLDDDRDKAFYILKGFEGCLAVYNQEGFDKLMARLEGLDTLFDEKARNLVRTMSSSVVILPLDSHGRISLGKPVLDSYSISRNVTIIGALDHFEIWNPSIYERNAKKNSSEFEPVPAER